jgi:hypothetical protein
VGEFRRADYPADFPTLIKIDVEGFEDTVVEGARDILTDPRLKFMCIEVHFLELNRRGHAAGATEIASVLRSAGFNIEWTDPSHIVAKRRP